MSLNREQNIVSTANLLPSIPLKKRKVSMIPASVLSYDDDDDDDCDDETHMKNRIGGKVQFDSLSKGDCGSLSSFDYNDDDDDDETKYINPYLKHVRNNVESQPGEASHSCVSSFRNGSSRMFVSDINKKGQNLRAHHSLYSSLKYFNSPDALCDTASYINKYPFNLARNAAGNECSELSRDIPSNVRLECGEKSDNTVSSLMQKATDLSSESVLNENSVAHTGLSSAPLKYFSVPVTSLMMENENSGILGDRSSSVRAEPDPMPSSSSNLCEDLFPLNYASHSGNVFTPLSAVGTSAASASYNNMLLAAFRAQVASFENGPLPNYNSGIKPNPARNQICELPSSWTLQDNYRVKSEFSNPSKPSLQTHDSRPGVSTNSSSSPKLPEREPYSSYKHDVNSKIAKQKSDSPSAMTFTEHGISPDFNWNNHRENGTVYPSVPEHSNSTESVMNVERYGGAGNYHKNEVKYFDSDSSNMVAFKSTGGKLKLQFPHIMERTPYSETGTARDIDTMSKQQPSCSYEGSQGNLEKRVGENISVLEHQCQGRETDTKEECCAVGNILLTRTTNSCGLEDSGILPVKSKGVQNVVERHYDVHTDDKNSCESDPVICVDDIQPLNCEWNRPGNSGHEEAILVSDDSDDDDDIEIVKCLAKSTVGKMYFSVQQKALDFTKSRGRFKNRNHKDNGVVSVSKSFVKRNWSSSSNRARNFVDEQAGDERLSCRKSVPKVRAGTATDCRSRAAVTPRPDIHRPSVAQKAQALQSDVYDLSYSPVNQSTAIPSSPLPMSNDFKLPRRKQFHAWEFFSVPYAASPLDLHSSVEGTSSLGFEYPLGCESTSLQYVKNQSFAVNLMRTLKEGESGEWHPPLPNSSSGDVAASSSGSIVSKVPNLLQMSVEPGNQKECSVLPKDTSQPMPVSDVPMGAPGVSHNMQEGKEVVPKQQNPVEDKADTGQRNSRPEWECAICLDTLSSKRGISATICGHVYCTACITEVVRKNKECPTCRRALDSVQVLPLFISG